MGSRDEALRDVFIGNAENGAAVLSDRLLSSARNARPSEIAVPVSRTAILYGEDGCRYSVFSSPLIAMPPRRTRGAFLRDRPVENLAVPALKAAVLIGGNHPVEAARCG